MSKYSALILDRDGTIVAMMKNSKGEQDSPWYSSQLLIYPELHELLKPWKENKIPIFIVTNQPGIAKGKFTLEDLKAVNSTLMGALKSRGVEIQDIFACTHHPIGTESGDQTLIKVCECRKPLPDLFYQLSVKHQIDLSRAVYIGDSLVDQVAAENAGIGDFFSIRTFISDGVPARKRFYGFPSAPSLKEVLKRIKI